MPIPTGDYGRYSNPGGRPVNDMGHTTPDIERSDSQRPAVPFYPAPYLPAARFDEHKRANVVLSAGTPVALDAAGAMVPAGTPVGHAYDYTALDATTGLPATKNAATGAAITTATTAVMQSGLGNFRTGYFLQPIGVVSYNAYQFEGYVDVTNWTNATVPPYSVNYDNPANFPIHNTQAQPETLVAVTCDYVLDLPYIWGRNLLADAVKIFDNTANQVDVLSATAKSYPFAHDELIRNAGGAVLGSGLDLVFISPSNGTGDTGLAGSGYLHGTIGALKWQADGSTTIGTAVDCSAAGYHILYDGDDSGKYVVVKTDTDIGNAFVTSGTITYKGQDQIQPGDFVAARLGKVVKWCPDRMEEGDKLGQVLRVRTSEVDRAYLSRVKTAYDNSATPSHRMAGSATRGVPYLHNLVTDSAQVILDKQKKLDGTALTAAGLPTSLPIGGIVVNLLR